MLELQRLETFSGWLLWAVAQNSLVTAMMVPIVLLLCQWFRKRPAVQHLLWLIVLVKFVTPPLPGLTWQLPELAPRQYTTYQEEYTPSQAELLIEGPFVFTGELVDESSLGLESLQESATPREPNEFQRMSPQMWLRFVVALWGIGAIIWSALRLRRTLRYYRMVRSGTDAVNPLASVIESVSKSMGLARLNTRVVPKIASPFLCCLGRVRLAWPQSLLSLDEATIRVIAAHEAAHLRRCDHWVAWIELAASIAWWWNPVFWFVRRHLRNAAELSCDAMALEAYPDDRCLYAETLLWLSAGIKAGAPPLQLAIGSGAPSSLERRIHMIATDYVSGKVSKRGAALAALLLFGCLPGWSFAQTELGVETEIAVEAEISEGAIPVVVATEALVEGDQLLDLSDSTQSSEGGGTVREVLSEGVVDTGRVLGLVTSDKQEDGKPAPSSIAQQVLRIKAMQLIAVSENRTADAEALATAIRILEASPEAKAPLSKENLNTTTSKLYRYRSTKAPRSTLRYDANVTSMQPVLSTSGNFLRGLNSLAFRRKVTGSNAGTIWGVGVYTDDSPVAVAAVHAGLLKVGETKDIVLIVEPGKKKYSGEERNGISSSDYGSWPGSYRLASVEEYPDAPYLCHQDLDISSNITLESLKDQMPIEPGVTLIIPIMGNSSGFVWGSGPYTTDSSLNAAAVHAGIVAPGQPGLCKVTILDGLESYAASAANGVATRPYQAWEMSFEIEAIAEPLARSAPEASAK